MIFAGFARTFVRSYPDLLGRRVLVALSGGPDSVALLHLMRHPELRLELMAAHVHHGTRGPEADADAAFCRELCEQLSVPFHLRYIAAPEHPAEGREAAWRRLRYQQLAELGRQLGAVAVATGHQGDDVAEGVLVQILRGAGPRALAGISPRTEAGVIRPLLPYSRAQIIAWLSEQGIGWREDTSNRNLDHLRNAVRHRILPALEEQEPAVRSHLVRLAGALADDESYLATELARRAQWLDPWDPDGGVPLSLLAGLHAALLTRWLHAQTKRAGIGRASRRQAELLQSLVNHGSPRAVTLGGRWRLRAARGSLWLEPPSPVEPYRIPLEHGSVIGLPLPGWAIRVASKGGEARWSFEAPAGLPLIVRSPEAGDKVVEEGRPRSLAPLLARHLPRHLRTAWPVVCSGVTIVWVPGVWSWSPAERSLGVTVEVVHR